MASDDLAAFLRAQWDAEEKTARRIKATRHGALIVAPGDGESPSVFEVGGGRLLAEVDAKRCILDEHAITWTNAIGENMQRVKIDVCQTCSNKHGVPCTTVRLLALPYADVDGYRENWRPR